MTNSDAPMDLYRFVAEPPTLPIAPKNDGAGDYLHRIEQLEKKMEKAETAITNNAVSNSGIEGKMSGLATRYFAGSLVIVACCGVAALYAWAAPYVISSHTTEITSLLKEVISTNKQIVEAIENISIEPSAPTPQEPK